MSLEEGGGGRRGGNSGLHPPTQRSVEAENRSQRPGQGFVQKGGRGLEDVQHPDLAWWGRPERPRTAAGIPTAASAHRAGPFAEGCGAGPASGDAAGLALRVLSFRGRLALPGRGGRQTHGPVWSKQLPNKRGGTRQEPGSFRGSNAQEGQMGVTLS